MSEPPLEVFENVTCPGCGSILKVAKGRSLKTRREKKITLICDRCGSKFRVRWTY